MDQFLWKGSPNPTLVQWIGAWIVGLFFVLAGAAFLVLAVSDRSLVMMIIALGLLVVGVRIVTNGLRMRKPKTKPK